MENCEFERKLKEIEPVLYAIARKYFRCHADQQDAVQDCMYKAWRSREQLKCSEAFKSWIMSIMKNECVAMCRRSAKHLSVCKGQLIYNDDPIAQMIDYEALYDALNRLSVENRNIICNRYLDGYSLRELSEAYNMNISTIQTRIHRLLKQLALLIL